MATFNSKSDTLNASTVPEKLSQFEKDTNQVVLEGEQLPLDDDVDNSVHDNDHRSD